MEEGEEVLKERRMDIARRLLETVDFPKVKGQARSRQRGEVGERELRYQRTLKLITNPAHQTLYSINMERKLMTETGLQSVIADLEGITKRHCHARVLIVALRDALKVQLFILVCNQKS
jgi:hypothetical protein